MTLPVLYADFNNADARGRVRLNGVGTVRDLGRLGLQLRDGLSVRVHDEQVEADGEVRYSADERLWVAEIDWAAVRRIAG